MGNDHLFFLRILPVPLPESDDNALVIYISEQFIMAHMLFPDSIVVIPKKNAGVKDLIPYRF
jgi:hypothetical protein